MRWFSKNAILIVVVVVVLWFSTFAGYLAGHGVRAAITIGVLVSSLLAAVCGRGRKRAFWIGFFTTMLLVHLATTTWIPDTRLILNWVDNVVDYFRERPEPKATDARANQWWAIIRTIDEALTLSFSLFIGFIGCHIYDL